MWEVLSVIAFSIMVISAFLAFGWVTLVVMACALIVFWSPDDFDQLL